MDLQLVWQKIESKVKCQGCPLEKESGRPLIIKPARVNKVQVMVATEGPNRKADKKFLTSIANHPTYTFLSALFSGRFQPEGASANVYWTHVRKCFINGNAKGGRKALRPCSNTYLESEIKALKPKLILSVGNEALKFLSRYDKRLKGKITDVFKTQDKGIFKEVSIDDFRLDVAVVPHPSGLNRFWNNPPKETLKILQSIMNVLKSS